MHWNSINYESFSKFKLPLIVILYCVLVFCIQSALSAAPDTASKFKDIPIPKYKIDPGRIKARVVEEEPKDFIGPNKQLEEIHKVLPKEAEAGEVIKFKLYNVAIIGTTVYKKGELSRYYKPYLGKDISFQDLQNIASLITAHYRKDGYVISRAIIPAQQVLLGEVTIQVIEGYIATVYTEGDISKVRSQIEKCSEKIKQMRPLQVKRLERYVLLLNDIPGLTVKTVLSPATSAVGAADLTFIVEQKRVSADLSYDNRGSLYMGPDEIVGVISVNDFIVGADSISLQTIDTPTNSELRYLQLSYSYPLGINGWRMNVHGDLTETNPGFSIDYLDLVGRSKNVNVEIEYPLLRTRTKNFWLYGEFDWLNSYTRYASDTIFQDHIRSLRFGISYDFIDNWKGANLIELEMSKGLFRSPSNPKPPLSRTYGRTDYTKANMKISRYQSLGERFILLVAASGQYPFNNPLLSAEEFSFGGQQFGRAYDSSEIAGDSGIAGKLELRFNTYPNFKFLQQIQYYTFYDIGAVWNIGGEDFMQHAKDSGSDLGFGLRTTFSERIYGNIELAKPLTRKVDTQVTAGRSGKAMRLYFGLGTRL